MVSDQTFVTLSLHFLESALTDEFFSGRLLNGERLLWTGRPKQGVLFTGADVFMVPFSLVWSGMVVSFLFIAERDGSDGMTTLVLTAFLCLGFYMLIGRFIVDAWVRQELRYAVTDRRLLIARPPPFSKFTSLKINQLPEVDLNERLNGQGTIRFGPPVSMWRGDGGWSGWTPVFDPVPQFLAIDDARQVFDLIERSAAELREK
jgi:hypothetical protein